MFSKLRIRRNLLISVVTVCIACASVTIYRSATAGGNDYESIELFTDVLAIVKKSYVEEVDTKKLIYGAINGMLTALDPHSSFMPPDTYKEMKIETKGTFGGLGIEITIKDGILTVISPSRTLRLTRRGSRRGTRS